MYVFVTNSVEDRGMELEGWSAVIRLRDGKRIEVREDETDPSVIEIQVGGEELGGPSLRNIKLQFDGDDGKEVTLHQLERDGRSWNSLIAGAMSPQ